MDIFYLSERKIGVRFNERLKPKLDPISITLTFVFMYLYIKNMYRIKRENHESNHDNFVHKYLILKCLSLKKK